MEGRMRHNPLLQVFAAGLLITALYVTPAFTQWSTNPNFNNAICTATGDQEYPAIVSDGSGGAIITWVDYRNSGTKDDIYAQRVDATGAVMWMSNGVAICTAAESQFDPTIISDGNGGAIITWEDNRSGVKSDIYAQRVNATGTVMWTSSGVAVCTAAGNQYFPTLVSDGYGGAIITWYDERNGNTNPDIYAQRVNASGAAQWTADGVIISAAANLQYYPTLVSDGLGGAIIAWQDLRNGSDYDIYAQRVNASGAVQWTANGIAVCMATGNQEYPKIVSDGANGAIMTWTDDRNGASDIYAQRVNASGSRVWNPDGEGVAVCTAIRDQNTPAMVSDGYGGAIITWTDNRGNAPEIYAQDMSAAGRIKWDSNGVAVCTAAGQQKNPGIVSDGSGGAIIMWQYSSTGLYYDIYAQHVIAAGYPQWITDGVAICTAVQKEVAEVGLIPVIVSDGSGGAIITWEDHRNGDFGDIYAQKVDGFGYLGDAAPSIVDVKDVINDQGGNVTVMWNRSYLDVSSTIGITTYSIYRGVKPSAANRSYAVLDPGNYSKWENSAGEKHKAYLALPLSVNSAETIYWENVGSVNGEGLEGYSYNVSTASDSGPQGVPLYYFMVRAKNYLSALAHWDSFPDSGYSVDNLPPLPVANPVAILRQGPSVSLHWNPDQVDPDVGYYEVHRSLRSNFTPGPGTKIGETRDTLILDNSPVADVENYYKIVTYDIHGNPSAPSHEASVIALGVGGGGNTLPAAFALNQNYPNPFNPTTIINYQLPSANHVTLKVYDMLGQEVATLANGVQEAGYKTVEFNAANLPSGIYTYRLNAGTFVEVKKMLVLK